MTFGQRLKRARIEKGMTQKQLADLISAKHNSISNWEKDINKPDPYTIELLCGVLDVSPNYLLSTSDDGFSPSEKLVIKKYRELDEHGTKMVDFTLQEEWERSKSLISEKDIVANIPEKEVYKPNIPFINAAHARTDIEIPDGIDTSDDDIMDDEDF